MSDAGITLYIIEQKYLDLVLAHTWLVYYGLVLWQSRGHPKIQLGMGSSRMTA